MQRHQSRGVILALTILAVVALVASTATARGPGGGKHHKGPPPLEKMLERHADELGLDDATLDKADEIAEEARDASEPLRDAVKAARETLREVVDSDAPTSSEIKDAVQAVADAQASLKTSRIETMLQIRALLTDEQRAKLEEMRAERGEQRQERRGQRRRGPRTQRSAGGDQSPGQQFQQDNL